MLEPAVVAVEAGAAVFAVVDEVACVLSDESSTTAATTVYSPLAARFGWVFRKRGFALRRREVARLIKKTVVTTEVEEVCTLGSAIMDVTVSTLGWVADGITGAADNNKTDVD